MAASDSLFIMYLEPTTSVTPMDIPAERSMHIPTIYTGLETWPKRITFKCWNCHRKITSMPIFIPHDMALKNVDGMTSVKSARVEGLMCTFSCAMKIINDRYSHDRTMHWTVTNYLLFLCQDFTGSRLDGIISAPSIYETCDYGGEMTAADYYQIIKDSEPEYQVDSPLWKLSVESSSDSALEYTLYGSNSTMHGIDVLYAAF